MIYCCNDIQSGCWQEFVPRVRPALNILTMYCQALGRPTNRVRQGHSNSPWTMRNQEIHMYMFVYAWTRCEIPNSVFWAILRRLGIQEAPRKHPGDTPEDRRRPGGQGHLGILETECVFSYAPAYKSDAGDHFRVDGSNVSMRLRTRIRGRRGGNSRAWNT